MSAEGKPIGLNIRDEEADFKRAVGDWSALPHKLVAPLLGYQTATLLPGPNCCTLLRMPPTPHRIWQAIQAGRNVNRSPWIFGVISRDFFAIFVREWRRNPAVLATP
jgi:hypothetical protein